MVYCPRMRRIDLMKGRDMGLKKRCPKHKVLELTSSYGVRNTKFPICKDCFHFSQQRCRKTYSPKHYFDPKLNLLHSTLRCSRTMSQSNSLQSTKSRSKFDPFEHLNVALNADGTLTRFVRLPTSPVTGDNAEMQGQAVASKEFVLDAAKKTTLRLYRPAKIPSNDSSVAKLPIMLYFHTGGWILFNIENTMIHENCSLISKEIPAIVISVGYRLAPENRLPAPYDDAVDSLKWLQNQAVNENGEPWLREYGDFSRCYLFGSSAGANIAFNAALRILDLKLDAISIVGMILNQPLFSGNKRTKSELSLAADPFFPLPVIDLLWDLALPHGTDRDHRYCNPLNDVPSRKKIKHLGRTLVIGFGGDPLIDRQQAFVEMLVLEGVQVEARFDDVGFHGIDMIDARRAAAILGFIKDFV